MKSIERRELQELLKAGAIIAEALASEEHHGRHIPSAVSLPTRKIDADLVANLDKSHPIIVYCWDSA